MINLTFSRLARYILVVLAVLFTITILIIFFEAIPIEGTTLGMDWRSIWFGIEGGVPRYGDASKGLRNPPWSLIPILPLGFLPLRTGWALIAFATLSVLVISVPKPRDESRKGKMIYWACLAILVLSYPALRVIVDGNFEFLVIGGILLMTYGYEAHKPVLLVLGGLLAAAKIQETWILLLVFPISLWKVWSIGDWFKGALTFLLVTTPSMLWKGEEWLNALIIMEQRGGIMDSSLLPTLDKLGIPPAIAVFLWIFILATTIIVLWKMGWSITRPGLGFLVAASLLLAPYAAGNNYLTAYPIGVIPLVQLGSPAGLTLAALTNAPYLFIQNWELLREWGSIYWTLIFVLSWITLGVAHFKGKGEHIRNR